MTSSHWLLLGKKMGEYKTNRIKHLTPNSFFVYSFFCHSSYLNSFSIFFLHTHIHIKPFFQILQWKWWIESKNGISRITTAEKMIKKIQLFQHIFHNNEKNEKFSSRIYRTIPMFVQNDDWERERETERSKFH